MPNKLPAAVELGRRGGLAKGAPKGFAAMALRDPERLRQIAQAAAKAKARKKNREATK